mmetsp:Transcript_28245/g.34893  ORF Transcript_28245/g.34893 Transcript_28245/m.34893 type:complete len:275 (-) Transcript_28245:94-918(-)
MSFFEQRLIMLLITSLLQSLSFVTLFLYSCDAFSAFKTLEINSSAIPSLCDSAQSTRLYSHIFFDPNDDRNDLNRRTFFFKSSAILATATGTASTSTILSFPTASQAEEMNDSSTFKRTNSKLKFGYEFYPPTSVITTTNKPLQTHLDEINLPTAIKGYTYGITVDPIRITSLREFGTPSEVAAKIVMAELRRDGVLDVTLGSDAKEDERTGSYDVEYLSDGKRGKKHFVTRSVVKEGKLFVMTVQVKEEDWVSVEKEIWDAVQSFKVLDEESY